MSVSTGENQTQQTPAVNKRLRLTAYKRWVEEEGVEVFHGFYVPNLNELELGYWKRMGARAKFLDLEGTEEWNDAYVCELPAKEASLVQHHLFEVIIYVLEGSGSTAIKNNGDHNWQQFEWKAGSLFALPPNIYYRHFNSSPDRPARFLAVTSAPLVMSLFHNDEFVWEDPFVFRDRYAGDEGHFSSKGVARPGRIWESNFVPDVASVPLEAYPERGAAGTNMKLEIGNSTLTAHISEFPVGTYKKAHRHGPGAHVIIVSGQGYSLMWRQDEEKRKFDWEPGSLIVPPGMWFHQHFNAGRTPARYLAIRWNSQIHPLFTHRYGTATSIKDGGDQVEYEDQDIEVDEIFKSALEANGVKVQMHS